MNSTVQPARAYTEYWTATLVRGLLALLAATAILFLPEMAATILLRPFAIIIAVLCLGAYATVDSAIVFITSFMVPGHRIAAIALRLQGFAGIVIGVLLFLVAYDHRDLQHFLLLAAAQAAAAAIAEPIVAIGTTIPHTALWGYAASVIAAVSAIALVFGTHLDPRQMAWLLYTYLGVFGLNLIALAAHMLFAERKLLHHA